MALQGEGVVTIGETMALLTPPAAPRLRDGAPMTLGIGGAESNVAIALARLGHPVTWISRLGNDDFGTLVEREIRAEGVTVLAERDEAAPTGLMVKEARGGRTVGVRYYRAGSAASKLTSEHVEAYREVIAGAAVLHLTGITPALGEGDETFTALSHAIQIARENQTLVSFDVNYRTTLWRGGPEHAVGALGRLAHFSDLVFAGPEEAVLASRRDFVGEVGESFEAGEALAEHLHSGGSTVLKLGATGALGLEQSGVLHRSPTTPVQVTDAVGAGDAFVGGYLSALLDGGSMPECLARANRLGGIVCQAIGDWEALPTRSELEAADHGSTDVRR
ncbi:sugar kinase [Kineosporia babensis]|uniref:Sugar kinase n=1 Tax=Kineosporia babensis TaxID=499548 RepID=A0A9X1NLJ4_9ACTN|nr:sugar kinase [Kineosporia babensis]MCD5316560.1 sugar kinase [Kineosporia babensis]